MSLPWWKPETHERRRPFLAARGRIKSALRRMFEGQGFAEVETACLQVSPGNETHLHAFATEFTGTDLATETRYLHTSPEFAMKKLLAAGEEKIFTFAPVFRNRERGPLHHPEFTMLEWYRANEPYEALMADCAGILKLACEAANARELKYRDETCDPGLDPERLTVAEAFAVYAGMDLLSCVTPAAADRAAFAAQARGSGIAVPDSHTFADIFSRVLVERIEPNLGIGRATILYEYPMSQAALAQPKAADPRVAERFELYVCGVEIANAFGELRDPLVQRWRFEAEMEEKERIHGERYPIDEDFLAALASMPPASGAALGFDRLAMLATAARDIEDVIWTPVARVGV